MGKPQARDQRHDEFFHRKSFEALAQEQGVRPVERLEDLLGGWPEDQLDDGFEDAVIAWRLRDARGEPG